MYPLKKFDPQNLKAILSSKSSGEKQNFLEVGIMEITWTRTSEGNFLGRPIDEIERETFVGHLV